ncbi:MAG: DUF4129 domain-containing protein [Armatimonadetes bacterium]|nr:DUF4129 domain-containing protein [Armatimonadota bacterium]MDE2206019.1 DUF4129 domain-containing protein [Armatimonadota bacterium]
MTALQIRVGTPISRCVWRLAPIWLVTWMAVPLGAAAQTPQRIHQDLHAILSSHAFHTGPLKESDLNRRVKGFADWFAQHAPWLRRLRLAPAFGPGWRIPSTPGLQWLIVLTTFGVAVWLLLKLWPSIRAALTNRTRRTRAGRFPPVEVKRAPAAATPESHLETARDLARNGEYRGAFREAYLALLGLSARAAGCGLSDGWTNVEAVLRLTPLLPASISTPLSRQTAQFERIWYGSAVTHADQVAACISECSRIIQPHVPVDA